MASLGEASGQVAQVEVSPCSGRMKPVATGYEAESQLISAKKSGYIAA